jgi:hypothetical protein
MALVPGMPVRADLTELHAAISGDGPRSHDLATAICRLIIEGAARGALEDRELVAPDGSTRTVKIIPLQWLERLQRAVNVGAFERLTVDQIVQRILLPIDGKTETV